MSLLIRFEETAILAAKTKTNAKITEVDKHMSLMMANSKKHQYSSPVLCLNFVFQPFTIGQDLIIRT